MSERWHLRWLRVRYELRWAPYRWKVQLFLTLLMLFVVEFDLRGMPPEARAALEKSLGMALVAIFTRARANIEPYIKTRAEPREDFPEELRKHE